MNIKSVMIGRKKALHQLIWVVERTKKRGNLFQSIPHSHCCAKRNIVSMQIFQFGNASPTMAMMMVIATALALLPSCLDSARGGG